MAKDKYTGPPDVPPMQFTPNVGSSQKTEAELTWLEPMICCPKCKSVVNGLGDAIQKHAPPRPTKFNQKPIEGVIEVGAPTQMVWTVLPCGHEVDQEWAAAYGAELARRREGQKPHEVKPLNEAQVVAKRSQCIKSVNNLYQLKYQTEARRASQTITQEVFQKEMSRIERDLVLAVNELLQRWPEAKDQLPPCTLMQSTMSWANTQHLMIPPSPLGALPTVEKIHQTLLGQQAPVTVSDEAEAQGYMKPPVNPASVAAKLAGKMKPTLQTLPEGPPPKGVAPAKPVVPPAAVATQHPTMPAVKGWFTPGTAPFQAQIADMTPLDVVSAQQLTDVSQGHTRVQLVVSGVWRPGTHGQVVDHKGVLIGYAQQVATSASSGKPMVTQITMVPVPGSYVTPEAILPGELVAVVQTKAQAQKIHDELMSHLEHGTKLSPEAQAFLTQWKGKPPGSVDEVSGPTLGIPGNANAVGATTFAPLRSPEELAEEEFVKQSTRVRRRVGRRHKRGKGNP